jgi:uncharacterized peroxidase-related enzyme
MPFLPSLPKRASLLNVFNAFPQTSTPLIELSEVILRGPSPFTHGERELIGAFVSGLNKCRYCDAVHTATAEILGVPRETVIDAIDDIDGAPIPDKMKPVLRYARKLTRQPDSITQSDVDAMFYAGWNETALYHTVAVTALFNFMNRLVEGLGLELDPAHVKRAAEQLARDGYRPLIGHTRV